MSPAGGSILRRDCRTDERADRPGTHRHRRLFRSKGLRSLPLHGKYSGSSGCEVVSRSECVHADRPVEHTRPGGLLARIKQLDESGPARVFDLQRYRGNRYFYQKRLPEEIVAKLYERVGLRGKERLLLDPDKYATNPDEHYSLNYYVPSLDGAYVAYGVSPSGSEDAVIHVLNLKTGKETGESIDRSWYGGISWLPKGNAFLHIRFQKLSPARHRLSAD